MRYVMDHILISLGALGKYFCNWPASYRPFPAQVPSLSPLSHLGVV